MGCNKNSMVSGCRKKSLGKMPTPVGLRLDNLLNFTIFLINFGRFPQKNMRKIRQGATHHTSNLKRLAENKGKRGRDIPPFHTFKSKRESLGCSHKCKINSQNLFCLLKSRNHVSNTSVSQAGTLPCCFACGRGLARVAREAGGCWGWADEWLGQTALG